MTAHLTESMLDGRVTLHCGDCRDVLAMLPENSIDSVVCDPPYHLTSIVKRFGADNAAPAKPGKTGAYARASAGFMGKKWDGGDIAFQPETWALVLRVLKPGGHLLAFGGTRTFGRMHVAIEDAGFEIRDMISWLYGSGFPKSHDVSKGIDRASGAEREQIATGEPVKRMIPGADQHKSGWEKNNGRVYVPAVSEPATDAAREWDGWGTALKPACEPIVLARKPLVGTVAQNVLAHGTGALNIDGCRIGTADNLNGGTYAQSAIPRGEQWTLEGGELRNGIGSFTQPPGRWPANVIHDGSEEVVGAFPEGRSAGDYPSDSQGTGEGVTYCHQKPQGQLYADSGSAARFFYTAKADGDDRLGSKHPTVKPLDLMQYLVRLVTPKGGLVLDPFAGTGTTGEACLREGMRAVLIEREEEYQNDIRRRMSLAMSGADTRKRAAAAERSKDKPIDAGPLFGGVGDTPRGQGRKIYGHFADQDERLARSDSSGE